jgi:hypothetical protein
VIDVVREDQKEDALTPGRTAVVSAGAEELGAAVRQVIPGGADALHD